MNYEPNTIDWEIDDLVIHDADCKVDYMLMRVIKIIYRRTGILYQTKYAFPELMPQSCSVDKNKLWSNEKRFLHDPQLFNITIPMVTINENSDIQH